MPWEQLQSKGCRFLDRKPSPGGLGHFYIRQVISISVLGRMSFSQWQNQLFIKRSGWVRRIPDWESLYASPKPAVERMISKNEDLRRLSRREPIVYF